MSSHRYGKGALWADGARASAGLGLAGLPLIAGGLPVEVATLLVLAAIVFAAYALVAFGRTLSRIDVSGEGIAVHGPRPARLAWRDVRRLRLAHYSTRRDGRAGWMQLSLAGGRARIVVDSRISEFAALARQAVRAADPALHLDPATIANLHALGIEPGIPVMRAGEACASETAL